jgi:hypothetical protein
MRLVFLIIISLACMVREIYSWQVYVRKSTLYLYNAFIATDEDRANVNYTDPCFESTGAICTYCCILSKEECSRDIRACEPVLVDDRRLFIFYILIGTMLAVMCGCPLFAKIMDHSLNSRCWKVSSLHKLSIPLIVTL